MPILTLDEIKIQDESVEETTHEVQKCVYGNEKSYLKFMSSGLSPQASLERLITELMATHVAHKIGAKAGLAVPKIQLVYDSENDRYGLLTSEVGLKNIEEFGSTKQNLIQALQVKAFAYVVALRFFLEDPDGHCNMGYQNVNSSPKQSSAFFKKAHNAEESFLKFSAIDFGLARYNDLEKNGYLLGGELGRFNTAVFSIDSDNIYKGVWQPDAEGQYQCSSPLAAFPGYDQHYDSIHETVIAEFNTNMTSCYEELVGLINNDKFEKTLLDELGLSEQKSWKAIINDNVEFLRTQAKLLGDTLSLQKENIPNSPRETFNAILGQ